MSHFKIMKASKEELFERMKMYLEACEETATVPTNKGFARSIGYSDSHLRRIRLTKPETYQGQLLEMFADTCCNILVQGGLTDILNANLCKFIANPHLTQRERGHQFYHWKGWENDKRVKKQGL